MYLRWLLENQQPWWDSKGRLDKACVRLARFVQVSKMLNMAQTSLVDV